jgi:Tol biopolymer transport system component
VDGSLINLTNRASADTTPVFSPDGRKIFIRTDAPDGITWNIQVITLNEARNGVQDISLLLEDVGGDDNWGLAKPTVR